MGEKKIRYDSFLNCKGIHFRFRFDNTGTTWEELGISLSEDIGRSTKRFRLFDEEGVIGLEIDTSAKEKKRLRRYKELLREETETGERMC